MLVSLGDFCTVAYHGVAVWRGGREGRGRGKGGCHLGGWGPPPLKDDFILSEVWRRNSSLLTIGTAKWATRIKSPIGTVSVSRDFWRLCTRKWFTHTTSQRKHVTWIVHKCTMFCRNVLRWQCVCVTWHGIAYRDFRVLSGNVTYRPYSFIMGFVKFRYKIILYNFDSEISAQEISSYRTASAQQDFPTTNTRLQDRITPSNSWQIQRELY